MMAAFLPCCGRPCSLVLWRDHLLTLLSSFLSSLARKTQVATDVYLVGNNTMKPLRNMQQYVNILTKDMNKANNR